jgi:hypothetical protein
MKQPLGEIVAQSEEEFSNVQGSDGWRYGFFVAPAPGGPYDPAAFKPFPTYRVTPWNYEWVGDQKYMTITPASTHPGVEGDKPVWTVRRYVSEVTGNLRLQGNASRPGAGDGTTVRIFLDGAPLWSQQLAGGKPADAKFDLTVPVKQGSLLDFTVDPGPGADISYDATAINITITGVP